MMNINQRQIMPAFTETLVEYYLLSDSNSKSIDQWVEQVAKNNTLADFTSFFNARFDTELSQDRISKMLDIAQDKFQHNPIFKKHWEERFELATKLTEESTLRTTVLQKLLEFKLQIESAVGEVKTKVTDEYSNWSAGRKLGELGLVPVMSTQFRSSAQIVNPKIAYMEKGYQVGIEFNSENDLLLTIEQLPDGLVFPLTVEAHSFDGALIKSATVEETTLPYAIVVEASKVSDIESIQMAQGDKTMETITLAL